MLSILLGFPRIQVDTHDWTMRAHIQDQYLDLDLHTKSQQLEPSIGLLASLKS